MALGVWSSIEGSAGIGKTRLLEEARDAAARAGMRVLAARGTELERDFPFALVRQAFEPALMALEPSEREESAGRRGAPGRSGRGSRGCVRRRSVHPPTRCS